MQKIAIHSKSYEPEKLFYIEETFRAVRDFGMEPFPSPSLKAYLLDVGSDWGQLDAFSEEELSDLDLFLSIGGDGTILESITIVKNKDIPILGINLGRLGFLATVSKDKIRSAMREIKEKRFHIEERILVELLSQNHLFNGINFALNEFAILKKDTSSMIVIHAYYGKEYLNTYWADGLIVSTPTGSTGYCLSAGGPIVLPNSRNFVIAPLSPHNLSVRPIVVPDDQEMSFEIEGRNKQFLIALDSRTEIVEPGVKLTVRKANFTCKIAKLYDDSFYNTLREKFYWGRDARNT